MVQWLSICLPMQGTLAQSLVPNDSTCLGATKHKYYKYWSLPALEPLLPNKRSHSNEKPAHCSQRGAPACQNQSKPVHSNEHPAQSKINKIFKKTSLKDQSLNIASLFHFINWVKETDFVPERVALFITWANFPFSQFLHVRQFILENK